jgi:hypothetical protein
MRSGTIALAAVLVFAALAAVAGAVGAGGLAGSHASLGAPLKASHAVPALAHPAATNYTNLAVSVTLTSAFPTYIQLPYNLQWTVSVTNGNWGVNASWMYVQIRDVAAICQGALGLSLQCPGVVNIPMNSSISSSVTNYNTTISTAAMSVPQFRYSCPAGGPPCTYDNGIFPNDQYQIYVFANENNTVANSSIFNNTANATWVDVTGSSEATGYLITANPSASLLAPLAANSITVGNISVAISYSGSYITGSSIDIYAGTTSASAPVYTQGLFAPGAGPQTVVAAAEWTVATPGAYLAVINITTPSGSTYFSSPLTVVGAGGGIVYENTTTYHNSTTAAGNGKIWGLSTQVAGTILLVVGLIIGMIVAFLLAMMVWGGAPKSSSPAQPWQSKTSNECSVCHQSFATEQELKDHAKSAHGMN